MKSNVFWRHFQRNIYMVGNDIVKITKTGETLAKSHFWIICPKKSIYEWCLFDNICQLTHWGNTYKYTDARYQWNECGHSNVKKNQLEMHMKTGQKVLFYFFKNISVKIDHQWPISLCVYFGKTFTFTNVKL